MGREELLHSEGAGVSCWEVAARMQGSEAGQDIHEALVRANQGDQEGAAFCEAECSLQVRPGLVASLHDGRAILASLEREGPRHHLFSDASGVFVCGGRPWFQLPWPQESASIAQKELIPVVIACILWGRAWAGQVVVAH